MTGFLYALFVLTLLFAGIAFAFRGSRASRSSTSLAVLCGFTLLFIMLAKSG